MQAAAPIENRQSIVCPLYLSPVAAGFPSPAEDYVDSALDLNELIVKHPAATFFVRASGESMIGAGIHDGDILAVDRSLKAVSGNVVIAVVNGEFLVKRLVVRKDVVKLVAAHQDYEPIEITPEMEAAVWGVVTHSIHQVLQ